jgi:hypothetical protein
VHLRRAVAAAARWRLVVCFNRANPINRIRRVIHKNICVHNAQRSERHRCAESEPGRTGQPVHRAVSSASIELEALKSTFSPFKSVLLNNK